jgi:hypothetical protein
LLNVSASFRTTSLKDSTDDIIEMCMAFFINFSYAFKNNQFRSPAILS